MLNMEEHSSNGMSQPGHRPALSRHLSSGEIDLMLNLLIELRETTQSCASHRSATLMIVELGGSELLGVCSFAQYVTSAWQAD